MANEKEDTPTSPDVHFEPLIRLPEVDVKTLEEDEEELLKLRAKLYRYVSTETPPEWKDRGTGDVKLLKHKQRGMVRLLMRRDKTYKICANHYIRPWMELKPNCGSDRAWVWSVDADFADEEPKDELLAIKFGNAENAKTFKEKFDECKKMALDLELEQDSTDESEDEVTKKINELTVSSDDQAEDPQEEKAEDPQEEKSEESAAKTTEKPAADDEKTN